ncbi:MAG TPA: RodZ domain-containing protein [Xanthomonadaceae bacterium]|nr:RodZ domain-containing protein [Xanthomonadaceae bacterium]
MQTESPPPSAQSSLGQQLRRQRLARHMSTDDVARQLKLPTAVIDAMECDDHAQLGAAVFARGRFGSYARLVGVPISAVEAQFAHALAAPPVLVSGARSSRVEYVLRRFARQGIYVVLTATIVLPVVWLATHNQLPQSTASLTALDGAPVSANANKPARTGAHAVARDAHNETPVAASIAPFGNYRWTSASNDGATATVLPTTAANPLHDAPNHMLQMRFSGDSWVDIIGIDGRVIEHGTVEAGSVRNYQTTAVARVMIGNSNSVLVLRNNEPLDIKPFQKANVTRFTLSSDGTPTPVRD